MRVTGFMYDEKIRVRAIGGARDGAFINLDMGEHCTISLPGYGAESVAAARDLAAKLLAAADAIEAVPDDAQTASALIGEFV